jgi:competence protein ComEA
MKRFTSWLALGAFVTALAAPLALAQGTSTQAPKPAAAPAEKAAPAAKPMHHKTAGKAMAAKMAKVDINSATKEDLEKVPGLTDATIDKIISGRPYKTKADLVKNKILTRAEYAKASSHIIAKQAAAASTTK